MAEKRGLSNNALFIGGFNLVVVLLAVSFFTRQAKPASESTTLQLATGEWSPYSGEHLPQNGTASALIRLVLNTMGYQANFHFMPWSQAEAMTAAAESESDIKGTFPYAQVGGRDRTFYYSVPIMDVEYGLYFNPNVLPDDALRTAQHSTSGADVPDWSALGTQLSIDAVEDLKARYERQQKQMNAELKSVAAGGAKAEAITQHYRAKFTNFIDALLVLKKTDARIVRIAGYEYPDLFTPLMDDEAYRVGSNVDAFKLLAEGRRRLVVIEATSVAKALIRQNYPSEYLHIYNIEKSQDAHQPKDGTRLAMAPQRYKDGVHLISGKKNPENYRFIKRFNKQFMALKNSGQIDQLLNDVEREMENEHQVRLRSVAEDGYLRGYLKRDTDGDFILLANGTYAIVLEWNADYMQAHRNIQDSPEPVMVKIKQGPHNGKIVYVDGRSISIQ